MWDYLLYGKRRRKSLDHKRAKNLKLSYEINPGQCLHVHNCTSSVKKIWNAIPGPLDFLRKVLFVQTLTCMVYPTAIKRLIEQQVYKPHCLVSSGKYELATMNIIQGMNSKFLASCSRRSSVACKVEQDS